MILFLKASVHLWPYLAHFFTELELFQEKFVEKIKTAYFKLIFPENRTVYEIT